jgi:pimeloyl-ACP methyl ester carboxylesterase
MRRIAAGTAWIAVALMAGVAIYVLWSILAASARESHSHLEVAPSRGHFVQSAGLQIYVQEAGPRDGRAVVLIPATAAWSETWRATLDALGQAGCRAIALDLPPFGFSQRPATNAFSRQAQAERIIGVLDALEVREATLVGHSIAGRATLEAAMRDRARTRALVLVAASAGLDEAAAPPGVAAWLFAQRALRNALMAVVTQPAPSRFLLERIMHDPQDATDALVGVFRQPLVLVDSGARMGDWLNAITAHPDRGASSDPARYADLRVPALIVWGRQDKVIPLAEGERLARLLPQAKLVVLEDINHAPHLEDSRTFNRLLLEFLGGCAR